MYPTDYLETTPLDKFVEAESALAWMRQQGFIYEAMRTDDLPVLRELIHAFCQVRVSQRSELYTLESVA
jgi:hypothetical protein